MGARILKIIGKTKQKSNRELNIKIRKNNTGGITKRILFPKYFNNGV